MGLFQIVAAALGFSIIAVVVWKIVRNGLAGSNGKVETFDLAAGRNTEWTGDGP